MKKIKIVLKKMNVKTKEIYEKIVKFDENIKELNLSNQNLIEIPKGLEQFKNLKGLWLDNNQITKIENLDKNINLNTLNLYNNQISKIENLDNLINLTYLNLVNNKITKIENLDKLVNLQTLDLEYNQITKIENIHHLDKLKSFWLFNSNQSENMEEYKQISFDNYNLEQKEKQIQKELLKQKQDKEYFDNNYQQIKQQFSQSFNKANDIDLII